MYSGGTGSRPQDSGGWHNCPALPCIAPAVVGSYRRLEGKLVQEPFLQQRGGRGERRGRLCGASEPGCLRLTPKLTVDAPPHSCLLCVEVSRGDWETQLGRWWQPERDPSPVWQ